MPKSSNAGHIDRAPDQEFPIAITTVPASAAQRKAAIGVIVGLMLVAALVAPFANRQLGRVDAFIPVLQTVLAVADFTTAVLLLAHCFMVPQQRAVLAVAWPIFLARPLRSCRRWPSPAHMLQQALSATAIAARLGFSFCGT
jgi:hypothetical protein